jgi:transposase
MVNGTFSPAFKGTSQMAVSAAVRHALRRANLAHHCLPAYSPAMNPIEPAWSKLKGKLRDVAPRTIEALDAALPDARAWFQHCGYRST